MSVRASFSKVLRNSLLNKLILPQFWNVTVRQKSLWTPDYVTLAEKETPEYDAVNIQIKGYDFVILEQFQKFIGKLARELAVDVNTRWAAPHKSLRVVKYKTNSTAVETEYGLKLYERNTQIVDVKSNIMALFLEAIITSCPPGVRLSVHHHCDEYEMDRYIPNLEIKELEEQIEQIGKVKKSKIGYRIPAKTS